MKFTLSDVRLENPCQYLKSTNILSDNNDTVFKNYSYEDIFAVLFSSKQLGIPGIIKIFNDNNLFSEINIKDNLYAKCLSISKNIIAVGHSSEQKGKIKFFNLKGNEISELTLNKPWFGNNLHFHNENLFTYYYENNKIYLLKYEYKFKYVNKELKFNTELKQQLELDCKSKEIVFTSNSLNLFVSTPHEKLGNVYVFDLNLNHIQNLFPNELSLSLKEYGLLTNNGYGLFIDSNNEFLVVGSPNLYQCFNENDTLTCYRGMVYVYKINNEKKYEIIFKLNNPTPETSMNKIFNDYFSVGLKLSKNDIYIGNPSENYAKGAVHILKINEDSTYEPIKIIDSLEDNYGIGFDIAKNTNDFLCINSFELVKDGVFAPSIVILENK